MYICGSVPHGLSCATATTQFSVGKPRRRHTSKLPCLVGHLLLRLACPFCPSNGTDSQNSNSKVTQAPRSLDSPTSVDDIQSSQPSHHTQTPCRQGYGHCPLEHRPRFFNLLPAIQAERESAWAILLSVVLSSSHCHQKQSCPDTTVKMSLTNCRFYGKIHHEILATRSGLLGIRF